MKSVIILGGGASGMLAAITAARGGCEVTILEKKEQLGKKLSITGNGRCNILNSDRADMHFHGSDLNAIKEILGQVSNESILDIFKQIGVFCRAKDGLYYPMSNKAQTVVGMLNAELKRLGVKIKLNCNVLELKKYDKKWIINTSQGKMSSDAVIISVGSRAGLSEKEDYNGEDFIKALNLKALKQKPALCALISDDKVVKYWSGNRCEADIALYHNNELIRKERGELMLSEDGISGIAAFQLSHYVTGDDYVLIDFAPEISREELSSYMLGSTELEGKKLGMFYEGFMPTKLANTLVTECIFRNKIFNGSKAFELVPNYKSEAEAAAIIDVLKNFRVNIKGVRGYKDAQVCRGGICLDHIDKTTMEYKDIPDLYITGEILDMAGDCGGYNLMWAWATGILAGNAASLKK